MNEEEWELCGWEVTYKEELGLCIVQEAGVGQYLYHEREVLVAMIEALDATKKEISNDSSDVVSTDSINI